MDTVTLHVRDADRQRVALIEDFASATIIPRFNQTGAWLIQGMPLSSRAAQALVPGAGIIAMLGDRVLLSGPLVFPEITWGPDGYLLNASGTDDLLAVFGRLMFPDPSAYPDAVTGKWSVYSDDRGPDPAETVMKEYVDANAGPGALSARRWAGLTIAADQGIGDDVSFSARNYVLGDALSQLAIAGGGLRFTVTQDDEDLVFDVTQPADRTATARFSPVLGNLDSLKYGRKMATTNWALVGGGGEGVDRVFVSTSNPISIAAWGMMVETFRDQRQTEVVTELLAAGQEELENNGDQTGLELVPLETEAVTFGDTYDVGDEVTVIVNGVAITDIVREARIEVADDVATVTPVVGTPGAVETGTDAERGMDLLFNRMRQQARRLSLLEVAQ